MKAYHVACNSSKLSLVVEERKGRIIMHDFCDHCQRPLEGHEIIHPTLKMRSVAKVLKK